MLMSACEAAETVAKREPVEGLSVSSVLPEVEGTKELFMKRPVGTVRFVRS